MQFGVSIEDKEDVEEEQMLSCILKHAHAGKPCEHMNWKKQICILQSPIKHKQIQQDPKTWNQWKCSFLIFLIS